MTALQNNGDFVWAQLGRDLVELTDYPSTTGDKLRCLKEVVAAMRRFRVDSVAHFCIADIPAEIAKIEELQREGKHHEAAQLAAYSIGWAYNGIAGPTEAASMQAEGRRRAEAKRLHDESAPLYDFEPGILGVVDDAVLGVASFVKQGFKAVGRAAYHGIGLVVLLTFLRRYK